MKNVGRYFYELERSHQVSMNKGIVSYPYIFPQKPTPIPTNQSAAMHCEQRFTKISAATNSCP